MSSRTRIGDSSHTSWPGPGWEPRGAVAGRGGDASPGVPEVGGRVGPYRLVEPLGSGGQAVVWRAEEGGPPPREVALKLLVSPPMGRRGHLELLRGEARHGRRIDHPSILAISDHGVADGVPYLAMPLVEGGSLADALDQRRRRAVGPGSGPAPADAPWLAALGEPQYSPAVARVVARVARALHAAHEADVIHCDVKPSNILLDRRRPGRVYLADFGVALDLRVATPEQVRALRGTPMYMAPEKLRGRPGDGKRCDIYALGVTLFEAATGVKPFRLGDEPCPALSQMAQVLAQEPLRPRAVAPRLSAELEGIILTAMAADPGRRYPVAMAMAEDLERFVSGRQVGALARRAV